MKTKEGLVISLENSYTHKSYSVFYKDIEYIYEFDYVDGLFDNESKKKIKR